MREDYLFFLVAVFFLAAFFFLDFAFLDFFLATAFFLTVPASKSFSAEARWPIRRAALFLWSRPLAAAFANKL